ncbi:hypothetical protein [Flavobacterium sp. 102]|uniref:hypothetical protein n=1 Tax=Flavobacterium sp. 102 TaxID=2135623 RepID=UPI000EB4D873|nr:hypothetical protein [Flavobacterium sp. 102]RKS02930.1 hypothetical protein C8C84_2663 [Flavobacterium sp. 102]
MIEWMLFMNGDGAKILYGFFDYKSIYVDFIDLYLPLYDEYFIRNGVLNEISFSSGSGLGCYVFPNSHCSGKW